MDENELDSLPSEGPQVAKYGRRRVLEALAVVGGAKVSSKLKVLKSLSAKVEKCCWASTVVGTSTATCLPSITALKAARIATSVFP